MSSEAVRGAKALLVAVLVALSLSPAAGWAQSSFYRSSALGSYLAGIEALNALDSAAAADRLLEAAVRDPGDPIVVSRAFLAHLVAGRMNDAAWLAGRVLDIEPTDELAMLTLGTVAFSEGRYDAAIARFEDMSDATIVGIIGTVLRAWAELGNGDPEAAQQAFAELDESGFGEFLTVHRALLAEVAGDTETALDYAEQAYEIDPFVVRTAEAYARILANAGRFDEAQQVIDDFGAISIDHPLIAAIAGPIAEGRAPGPFAANVEDGAAELLHGLGAALAREGSTELGVTLLRLSLYLKPDFGLAAITLGNTLSGAGKYQDANLILASLSADSVLASTAQVQMAHNFDRMGEVDQAVEQLTELAEREPNNIEVLGALGDVLRVNQRWEPAAEVYTRLVDQIDPDNPRNWRYYYVRAIALERAGRWDEAEADFLQALELSPNHPDVLNYLGYTWVDMGMNLDRALGMIQQAVALDPGNGYIIDSLGWAYYRLGHYAEAVPVLECAVDLVPDDPDLNDHLGDAYWQAGRQLEATFQWRIAADTDDRGGQVRERALDKLTAGLETGTVAEIPLELSQDSNPCQSNTRRLR